MSDVYYLKDPKTGYIEGKFEIDKADSHYIEGRCYSVVSWDSNGNPFECHYLAGVYCKWDACTHWFFYGKDYADEEDSYYHLCGPGVFGNHIRLMCFVWKLVADIMGERTLGSYFESETTRKLVDLMLDGYEIVKAEG